MALYQVSTRSTRRRRLGVAVRAWLSNGRHRASADREIDGAGLAAPTRRLPRMSLVPASESLTEALSIPHRGPRAEPAAQVEPSTPEQREPRPRARPYPNAYRVR